MIQNLTLNGIKIKNTQIKIERYRITKSERLGNGDMSMEHIARKRKFYFTYEAIAASDLNVILDIIWETNNVFYTLGYVENNVTKSAVVYAGSIPTEQYRTDEADWVWQNVTFNLIER